MPSKESESLSPTYFHAIISTNFVVWMDVQIYVHVERRIGQNSQNDQHREQEKNHKCKPIVPIEMEGKHWLTRVHMFSYTRSL